MFLINTNLTKEKKPQKIFVYNFLRYFLAVVEGLNFDINFRFF